ncbi:hypothetical protein Pcinc_023705 [Petrolisthes cinctipes]|uniref:Secreted protein n=1 Tax=Petrolisthes cinctipes TaxID=88211 RepID=A0AAE1FET5_PETCI|nr:hypothetical protein Pcinc_023705 [Petrolisthes cinctipes]
MGESLARVELFVLLVALLQNFTFTKAPGEVLSTEKDPNDIIVKVPKQYNLIITETVDRDISTHHHQCPYILNIIITERQYLGTFSCHCHECP